MAGSALPIVSRASSQVLSQALKSTNSTYKVLYFNLHGRSEMARMLLAFGGVQWEEIPITAVIERYLARKFNLMGTNEWEQLQIEQFQLSTESTQSMYRDRVLLSPPEKRVEDAHRFYNEFVNKFIQVHEAHLEQNQGGNGFYVGNQFSLADIKTTVFIDRLLMLRPKGTKEAPFSPEKSPNLWKVKENVNKHPNVVAWKTSQRYQELDHITVTNFKL
ncbi:hypothetical protein EDD11_000968 [Mortierella claussenii]|nr:hypothetical protein EDD11_000968 [Mortierella claussenii]